MAVFLSPGVYPREIDLSVTPAAVGALTPSFIGTSKKGPIQQPTFITNAQQFIDTFGEPFPESFLGYAVLAYFEEGARAWILRVGVECEEGQPAELADVCIDNTGAREHGWGRISVFTGINYGNICTRTIDADNPISTHRALFHDITYTDVDPSTTNGPCDATLSFADLHSYTGAIDDTYTVLVTSDPTAGSVMDGATIQVIRGSDGMTVLDEVVRESIVLGVSDPIDAGDGIVFTIQVVGSSPLGDQDTFTFLVRPDNRKFAFNVDHQDSATVVEYTLADGATYTTAAALAAVINALIGAEHYRAVVDNDTVCFRTTTAGESIQLVSTEGFALEVGQVLFIYSIPRSFLCSTDSGPYNITTQNNRVVMKVIGPVESTEIDFTLAVGLNRPATVVAAAIHMAGLRNGERYWRSYAMLTPGGDEELFIETASSQQYSQLQLLADNSHLKTLRFAEELNIVYPYTRPYQVFEDSRVALPDSGTLDSSVPLSCEINPTSDQCAMDSAYFQNIVGWIVAKTPGTWIDSYKVTLEVYRQGTGEGDVAGRFRLLISDQNNVAIDSTEDITFDPRDARYIGNVINPGSRYGGTNGNSFIEWLPRPSFLGNDPVNDLANFEVRVPGQFSRQVFAGAANGIPNDPIFSSELDRAIIGNPAEETGIFAFQNPEVYDITLLVIPGVSSGAVLGQGLQMCEARGDCMMLIDPPFGLRAQQVVDWHNGILFSDLASAINSSYGALYHPWLKIYDQFSSQTIYIPPSGHVTAVYARTARIAEQWIAPAGLQRGRLLTPIDVEVDLTQGERDLLYGYGNAVNPIVDFPQEGLTVWGQRTLQRRASALDRVNVRLLLIYIKKNAIRFLRQFVFEPNDEITRAQVVSVSNPFLADIAARRGLTGFSVVCDERNNTPERIDRSELHCAFFLKPTRAAEFIQLNLVILRTEASFTADEVLAAGGVTLTA
jgi:phage tail sheath protein FI